MTTDRYASAIKPSFRRATSEDADILAQFIEYASEGLALYLWKKIAGPGRDPWSVGRERVLTGAVGLSFRNALLVEYRGRPAAGLISYSLGDTPEANSDQLPAVLAPLHELTSRVPDTWYVHVLAALPEHRGKGFGAALLAAVDDLAASARKSGMSLVVSDTNTNARKLYERCGYRELARCTMVKEEWQHPGTEWILLKKDLVTRAR